MSDFRLLGTPARSSPSPARPLGHVIRLERDDTVRMIANAGAR